MGYRFLTIENDVRFIAQGAQRVLRTFRGELRPESVDLYQKMPKIINSGFIGRSTASLTDLQEPLRGKRQGSVWVRCTF